MSLLAVLCALTPASASLARKNDNTSFGSKVPPRLADRPGSSEQKDELAITDDTEIELDGRGCKYADVPKDAEIILLDLSADKKTIKKIHFRSKK
jgi:hypothetical protein